MRKERKKYPEGTFTPCCAEINHLFSKYASEEIMAETNAEINLWKQHKWKKATNFWNTLWAKVLICGQMCEEYPLKTIFIERLAESLLQRIRNHCGRRNYASIVELTI